MGTEFSGIFSVPNGLGIQWGRESSGDGVFWYIYVMNEQMKMSAKLTHFLWQVCSDVSEIANNMGEIQ